MGVSDEERRDAEKTGELVGKKLLDIMDLQADIDTLLRDGKPTPFGSKKWQHASLEAMTRIVAMTALQVLLLEPRSRVKGNDELQPAAEELIHILIGQLKTLKTKKADWLRPRKEGDT